ncbi:MAG: hypothetical protein ACRDT1_04750, partial [Micromonosporaceae bacterium]
MPARAGAEPLRHPTARRARTTAARATQQIAGNAILDQVLGGAFLGAEPGPAPPELDTPTTEPTVTPAEPAGPELPGTAELAGAAATTQGLDVLAGAPGFFGWEPGQETEETGAAAPMSGGAERGALGDKRPGPAPIGSAAPGPEAASFAPLNAQAAHGVAPAGPVPADATLPTPEGIRSRTTVAAASLRHPAAPSPAVIRAPLDEARASIEGRGRARTESSRLAPGQLAGQVRAPGHGPRREDPGPIPEQMRDIAAKAQLTLPPASLPAVTRSPRGTLPDVTGPILAADQIRAIRIGDAAINAFTADPEERQRLRDIRAQLGAATAAAPAPNVVSGAAPAPTSVPISDEPVAGLTLGPEQRALFGRVVGQLLGDTDVEVSQVLTAIRTNHTLYPGGVLQREFGTLGDDLLPSLAASVREQANLLVSALQLAPDQIDVAIAERRNEVEAQRQAAAQAAADAANSANAGAARAATATLSTAEATRVVTVHAVTADANAARNGRPRTVQARAERAVVEIREQVSTGLARYDTQLRNRERAVSDAVRRQVSAYRLAQTRDELA